MKEGSRNIPRYWVEKAVCEYLGSRPVFCWCGDPWCQFNPPTLHLADIGNGWDEMEVLQGALHEATHLKLGRGGHDRLFWDTLTEATRKYLCSEMTPFQLKMMDDYIGVEQ